MTKSRKQQRLHTTLLAGDDLNCLKLEINSFRSILVHVQQITGFRDFSVEIIRQSESGINGCRDTILSLHKDTKGRGL